MKIAIFGGTFDPIHIGHLILAEWIRVELRLDHFVFIPTYIPPHKQRNQVTPAEIRLEMLKLAVRDNPAFEVSDIEIDRMGVSYSFDTIMQMRRDYNLSRRDLYFIVGADSILEFHLWHRPEDILSNASVIVYKRHHYNISTLRPDYSSKIRVVNNPIIDISSTLIRKRVADGRSIKYLVTPEIEKFILENRLYKKNVDFKH
ncbi:nicotinate-nucleotide adenylyltransferase [candidate division KSB1 bacterium]|nr:nicotinate-nucleotide adenylyltransferase [candidate division KSB1 bacterium]